MVKDIVSKNGRYHYYAWVKAIKVKHCTDSIVDAVWIERDRMMARRNETNIELWRERMNEAFRD